jgi:dienelactone hydrolase
VIVYRTMKHCLFFIFLIASTVLGQEIVPNKESGSMIFLRDYGTDDIGYLVIPDREPSAGVVVLPDRQGMTPEFKKFCLKLGQEGYLVLGLDLYNGRLAKDEAEAAQMAASLQEKNVSKTLRTGLKFFESSPRFQMEKKMLVAWGVSTEVTVRSLEKEKGLLSLVLLNPSTIPEKSRLLDLRLPLQILLTPSGSSLPEFRSLKADWTEHSRKMIEVREVDEKGTIDAVKMFFHRILTEPPSQTLIDKIF